MQENLKPCPFCDGDAEMDKMRQVRAYRDGRFIKATSVSCNCCGVEMILCHADMSGLPEDEIAVMLTQHWNTRVAGDEK